MPIPVQLPTGASFSECTFMLNPEEATNRTMGGRSLSMELADPFWQARIVTRPCDLNMRSIWKTWKSTIQSSLPFYLYDPERPYPRAFGAAWTSLLRAGGGAFDGTCTVTAAVENARTIALSTLPPNYQFKWGDYVSLPFTGGAKSLHLVTADYVATAGGVAAALPIYPWIRAGVVLGAGVQLVKAQGVFRITPGTFDAPARAGEPILPVTFEAEQVLP